MVEFQLANGQLPVVVVELLLMVMITMFKMVVSLEMVEMVELGLIV